MNIQEMREKVQHVHCRYRQNLGIFLKGLADRGLRLPDGVQFTSSMDQIVACSSWIRLEWIGSSKKSHFIYLDDMGPRITLDVRSPLKPERESCQSYQLGEHPSQDNFWMDEGYRLAGKAPVVVEPKKVGPKIHSSGLNIIVPVPPVLAKERQLSFSKVTPGQVVKVFDKQVMQMNGGLALVLAVGDRAVAVSVQYFFRDGVGQVSICRADIHEFRKATLSSRNLPIGTVFNHPDDGGHDHFRVVRHDDNENITYSTCVKTEWRSVTECTTSYGITDIGIVSLPETSLR